MGELSKIQWTDHTFNPWIGCVKVSPACKFCYAETMNKRFRGGENWGPGSKRSRTSDSNWVKPFKWNTQAGFDGIMRKVFCASLADVFEDHADIVEWRKELFALIENTPNLIWQLLTKRPENIVEYIPLHWTEGYCPENVWFGCTIENQEQYDRRWSYMADLKEITCNITFMSCEPLFESIKFNSNIYGNYPDWVIIGGESGHVNQVRRLNAVSIRKTMSECDKAGSKVFFKQLGSVASKDLNLKDKKGGDFSEYPIELYWLKRRDFPEL